MPKIPRVLLADPNFREVHVVVKFTLQVEGNVTNVEIEETSGYEVLDQSTIKAVQEMKCRITGPAAPAVRQFKVPFGFRAE